MSTNPELLDFIVFFESDPEWIHDLGWFYGARFVASRGPDTLIATVAPDDAEFTLEWRQGERKLMHFKLVMVTEWLLETRGAKEQLVLKAALDRELFCVLTLKPEVNVHLEFQW